MSELNDEPLAVNDVDLRDWSKLQNDAALYDKKHGLSFDDPQVEDQKEAAEELEIAALMSVAIQVSADMFAPNWDLQPEEAEQLGAVYGALLDKYMPDNGLGKYTVELSALVVTAAVLKSRAGIPMKKLDKKEKKSAQDVIKSQDEQQEVVNQQQGNVLVPKRVKNG